MLKSRQTRELRYNVVMRKFVISFLVIACVFLTAQFSRADEYKVLVLPDNIDFASTNYLIYPDSSVVFASDTINSLKQDGRIQTVSMTEVRDALRSNTKLSILTKKALKEFKYNYNIPFVDFTAIAACFKTDKILIITSQTDVQNYFLQRTLWDLLNIPSATVINPAYKLSTYAALIDVKKESVEWQNLYYKKISSTENRIVAQNFAPATEQLEQIKKYSLTFLSPDIAAMVQAKIVPAPLLILPESTPVVNVSTIQKKIEAPPEQIVPLNNTVLKTKTVVPRREMNENYGVIINDL